MFKNFFAINNPKLENLLKSTDFTIYQKQGLPLSYPRSQFLSDLDSILSKLDIQSKSKLLSKLQITELRDEQAEFEEDAKKSKRHKAYLFLASIIIFAPSIPFSLYVVCSPVISTIILLPSTL